MLQSIACGTREIIEKCEEHGVYVKRLVVTGGMAEKNSLLMREYASILKRTIYVGQVSQGSALGAAIFAAVAAGIYKTPEEAYALWECLNLSPMNLIWNMERNTKHYIGKTMLCVMLHEYKKAHKRAFYSG